MPASSFTPTHVAGNGDIASARRGIDMHAIANIACGRNVARTRGVPDWYAITDIAGRRSRPQADREVEACGRVQIDASPGKMANVPAGSIETMPLLKTVNIPAIAQVPPLPRSAYRSKRRRGSIVPR